MMDGSATASNSRASPLRELRVRRFVLLAHEARTAPDWTLDDPAGAGGRMDLVARFAGAALLTSHAMRRDVEAWLVLLGPPAPPLTMRLSGATLKRAGPDERTMAGLVRKATAEPVIGRAFVGVSPGVAVRRGGLAEVLTEAGSGSRSGGRPVVLLDEDGEPWDATPLPSDAWFVVGDHLDPTAEERDILAKAGARRMSLGPTSLTADQCVTVVHWVLDAAGTAGSSLRSRGHG